MLEIEVAQLIRAQGWKIEEGPYFNQNLAKKGVLCWSIKTTLSKEELKVRGIKLSQGCKPGNRRTVRFVGVIEDGDLTGIRHITSSGRKKLKGRAGSRNRTRRKPPDPVPAS